MARRDETEGVRSAPDDPSDLGDLHLARTDLQAVVQGAFMEHLLGLPRVIAELDRMAALLDQLAGRPAPEVSDEDITAERERQLTILARDLKLVWPWSGQQLGIGFWWRQQLVQAAQRDAARTSRPLEPEVPGWPPKWTYDRRALAVGGAPWALVNYELAPRLLMKRGDSLPALQARWGAIRDRVEAAFRSSMFSTYLDEGPPGGLAADDLSAYERYARWAVRWLVGGESYRRIARTELPIPRFVRPHKQDHEAVDPRERWREIKRGVRRALEVLDSI